MAVTDAAILKIKEMILSGELKPGDRLPAEKDLSERLGLSRSSLREAVKALDVMRVLDVRRGNGTYVTSLKPGLLLEAVSFVSDLHDDASVIDLLGVRRILEGAASRIAACAMSADDVSRVRGMVDAVGPDASLEVLVDHDLKFHAAIVSRAGNAYLAGLIESLGSRTARARVWRGLTEEGAVARTLSEHRAIVDALAARDGALAEALSVAHIGGVEHWLRVALR